MRLRRWSQGAGRWDKNATRSSGHRKFVFFFVRSVIDLATAQSKLVG